MVTREEFSILSLSQYREQMPFAEITTSISFRTTFLAILQRIVQLELYSVTATAFQTMSIRLRTRLMLRNTPRLLYGYFPDPCTL